MRVVLASSVLINLILATKIIVFDPNVLVRPICWDQGHDTLIELDGEQTFNYLRMFGRSRGMFGLRLDADEYVYVSMLDHWKQRDLLWNFTTKAVRSLIAKEHALLKLPPYETDSSGNIEVTCELARAVAINSSD